MKILLVPLALAVALTVTAVQAGSLAPEPRVIAEFERTVLDQSGAQTLEEWLDTGIARYFLTGGQPLLVLVNGRPYATTSSDLDSLPLSAIERIEIVGGETLGTFGGISVRGALNIVLRTNLEGFETRALARLPSQDGGDGWQGSVFWGGPVGDGRMTLGVDVLRRQEITARSREYSRSDWVTGGSFSEAQNISVGGNTVWIVQLDEGAVTGERSVSLGDCDPANGYTGPLSNPPGITSGDMGCGFAYGQIMWNSDQYEQQSAILTLDHPLAEDSNLHVDVNLSTSNAAFRYAPSVGSFRFSPNAGLLQAINDAAGQAFTADDNDIFVAAHRFVGHGNRDLLSDTEEYDVSVRVEGRLADDLGYDARLHVSRFDGFVDGNTFVHGGEIWEQIQAGNYDLENPFSNAPEHLQAIETSSLRQETDVGSGYLGAWLALEGSGFTIGGRDAAWTAGLELERAEAHSILRFRDRDGMTHGVSEVLGSGGYSFDGELQNAGAFAEVSLPLAENLNLRAAARGDELDDLGGMTSWRLGADYQLTEFLSLRGSWGAGDRTPPMWGLYSTEVQDHPYIECDPGLGSTPRSCTSINPRQVTRVTTGNPELDPSDSERLSLGVEARKGPFFVGVQGYRLTLSGEPGSNSADWAMRNLNECQNGQTVNCIQRFAGDITIFDRYANVVDTEVSGVNTLIGGGLKTSWGAIGLRGSWRHVSSAELRIAGEDDRYPIPENAVRIAALAERGNLNAGWTVSYRSSFENRAGTGTFESWTGHDVFLEWAGPLGMEGARAAVGVFNLTDAGLTVNTANPSSVDGPTEAGWGRTFFLSLNLNL